MRFCYLLFCQQNYKECQNTQLTLSLPVKENDKSELCRTRQHQCNTESCRFYKVRVQTEEPKYTFNLPIQVDSVVVWT